MTGIRTRVGVALVAVVIASTVALVDAGSATAAAVSTYSIGIVSGSAPAATMTIAQAKAAASHSAEVMAAATTPTPGGFKRYKPDYRRSNYTYDSHTMYAQSYKCNAVACTLEMSVSLELHEVALGGTSHTWDLTMNMKTSKNPGHLTWAGIAIYYCGVNVKSADDHECNNGAAPSDRIMSENTGVYKPWGKTNNITVFPMVDANVHFSSKVSVTAKFRGWDTLSRTRATKLNTSSGDGN